MIKILTVLKTGGEYNEKHVLAIKSQIERHVSVPFEFLCLSDIQSTNFKTIRIENNLSGWFAKLELFKITGPCLYVDLDTIFCSNIDRLISDLLSQQTSDIITMSDPCHTGNLNSCMLFWRSDVSSIYNTFISDTKYMDQKYIKKIDTRSQPFGDQNIIQCIVKELDMSWSFFPGIGDTIVSYKVDLNNGIDFNPDKHQVVYFHGKPRPWDQDIISYE